MALHLPMQMCVSDGTQSHSPNGSCNLALPPGMRDDPLQAGHHVHDLDKLSKALGNGAGQKAAWTDAATDCLIEVFEEKWNSLRRGNLKAKNWDEVGVELGLRCGVPKTGDQCRHKIEKLRGRFRQEKSMAGFSLPKWPWYERLNMVFGEKAKGGRDHNDFDGGEKLCIDMRYHDGFPHENLDDGTGQMMANQHHHHQHHQHQEPIDPQPIAANGDDNADVNTPSKNDKCDASFTSPSDRGPNGTEKDNADHKKCKKRKECGDFSAAMKCFAEGLLKIEQSKLEFQKETERLRCEMELKRTQMIEAELNRRTELLMNLELKRTEMMANLELRRTEIQMEIFKAMTSNSSDKLKKRSKSTSTSSTALE